MVYLGAIYAKGGIRDTVPRNDRALQYTFYCINLLLTPKSVTYKHRLPMMRSDFTNNYFPYTLQVIDHCYIADFHSTKWALWLVDSWSRAPDQIIMYPDRDTIAQLLPARRFVCLFWLSDCLKESLNI